MSDITNHDRRCKVYSLPLRSVIAMLNWESSDCIALPKLPELPAGYEVLRITWSFERDAMLMLVCHDSFDPISEGGEYPHAGTMWADREVFMREELLAARTMRERPAVTINKEDCFAMASLMESARLTACDFREEPAPTAAQPAAPKGWEFLGPPR